MIRWTIRPRRTCCGPTGPLTLYAETLHQLVASAARLAADTRCPMCRATAEQKRRWAPSASFRAFKAWLNESRQLEFSLVNALGERELRYKGLSMKRRKP